MATAYQTSVSSLVVAEIEREVRLAELELRKLEIAAQRRQLLQLEYLRTEKEQLALNLDIARLKRDLRETKARKPAQITAAQQKLLKKREIEDQIQQLAIEASRAAQRATTELEKRRLQNIYANRRERLAEELEKYI